FCAGLRAFWHAHPPAEDWRRGAFACLRSTPSTPCWRAVSSRRCVGCFCDLNSLYLNIQIVIWLYLRSYATDEAVERAEREPPAAPISSGSEPLCTRLRDVYDLSRPLSVDGGLSPALHRLFDHRAHLTDDDLFWKGRMGAPDGRRHRGFRGAYADSP